MIENESLSDVRDISAVVLLSDDEGNVKAVSSTKINLIKGGSSQEIVFSWPSQYEFGGDPTESRIYLRTDLTR